MIKQAIGSSLIMVLTAGAGMHTYHHTYHQVQDIRVMAVGGSTALGWGDHNPKGPKGFLARTFTSLSKLGKKFILVNDSVAGYGPTDYGHTFASELKSAHPEVVLFSYGILDDLVAKTPISKFESALNVQVKEAVSEGAKVVVLSPTISKFSYESKDENPYIVAEEDMVKKFHSKNIRFIDLQKQMVTYLKNKKQPYAKYMLDGWHMNARGHALAASILSKDLKYLVKDVVN